MSTYSPLNQSIFQAAFAGAFAGITGKGLGSGTPNLAIASGFSANAGAAFAFAQEYDTNRGSASATNTEVSLVESATYSAFLERKTTTVGSPNIPATWDVTATAVAAAVSEAISTYNGGTSGGGGGVTRAYTSGVATVATLAAPTLTTPSIFLEATLTAQKSGLYRVSASGTLNIGAPEAAGCQIQLAAITPNTATAPLSIGNGTPAPGGQGTSGVQLSSGTTAMTVTATGGQTVTSLAEQSNGNGLANSAVEFGFAFSGIFGGPSALPIALGEQVAFALIGQIQATTLTLIYVSFSVEEI